MASAANDHAALQGAYINPSIVIGTHAGPCVVQQAIAPTMDQEVFLLFKIELRKAPQARNVTRTF